MADDVLVEDRDIVESFEQVERDVGLPAGRGAPDVAEVVVDAERLHLMAHGLERGDDVVFGAPGSRGEIGAFRDRFGRNEVPVHEREDAQLRPAHNATRWRPLCR